MPNYYNPNTAIESKQRRKYADMLMQQSQQPQGTEVVGGYAVPQSPLAGLARAVAGGIGQYQSSKADALDLEQSQGKQQMMADALQKLGTDPQAAAGILAQNPETMDAAFKLYADALDSKSKAALEDRKYERELMRDDRKFENQKDIARMRMNAGGSYVDPETGEIVQAQPKLSPTSQKELYDTIDLVNQSQGALSDIAKAKSLINDPNGKPYSGFGSETLASLNRVPVIGNMIDDTRATNTTEYNTLVKGQALSSLKSIFGGNPTEGERAILMDMQALSDKSPQEQAAVLANAERAIQRRVAFNQSKAQNIQTGDFKALVDYGAQNAAQPAVNMQPKFLGFE